MKKMVVHKIQVNDIVGISEIANEADVKPNVVTNWRKRHDDFPDPIVELACGPLFDWNEVTVWLNATGRI